MNSNKKDAIARKSDCPSPNSSEGNDSRMMFDKANLGSMDDLNFNESSLDALGLGLGLLDEDNLRDSTNGYLTNSMASEAMGLRNSATAEAPTSGMQGITAGTDNFPFPSIPSIPYSIVTSNHPSIASYATNTYSPTAETVSLPSHPHQPIVPAPGTARPDELAVRSPPTTKSSSAKKKVSSGKKAVKTTSLSGKRPRGAKAVSEDEDEVLQRRVGRNLREQQRSQKITQQIDHLREVLASANITFKPDKYSTLVSVGEYIKELQVKAASLDAEHKKLIDTISRTNEMVNDQYVPASTNGQAPPGDMDLGDASPKGKTKTLFVPNIDYKSVFSSCGIPLAVASIDGRFLDCNQEFLRAIGYTREELLPCEKLGVIAEEVSSAASASNGDGSQREEAAASNTTRNLSLFNLLGRDHMEEVFEAMRNMLKEPKSVTDRSIPGEDLWIGDVQLGRTTHNRVR